MTANVSLVVTGAMNEANTEDSDGEDSGDGEGDDSER